MRNAPTKAPKVGFGDAISSTRAFYESNASSYASATVGLPLRARVEDFARSIAPRASVLDLGCGAGRDLEFMADYGLRPIGIDLAPSLAHFARIHSRQPVVVGDLRQLPFQPQSFDGAWASASLLHLPREELPGALVECRRLLKPGGLLFASVKRGQGSESDAGGRWFTYFLTEEWARLLARNGFKNVKIAQDKEQRWTHGKRQRVAWLSSTAVAD